MTEEMNNTMVCYKHPDRETLLRCNKCGRPICQECAVQTPTGYRCKDCIKEQQKVFDTSEKKDYIIGGLIAAVLGFAGAFVSRLIPFLPVYVSALIFGGAFGKIICTAVRAAVNKRRSKLLTQIVAIASAVGSLIALAQEIIINVNLLSWGEATLLYTALFNLLAVVLYIAVQTVTILADMNGMVFRR